ncbi:F-box/kelch-repeat protein At3g06240-like [Primulina huaijiensis]|uniref:F-box/kelch-repeat protein At3g06240-like n=1 Tax=Primulina huaijiensis TaxID=1492673 RepID=UPI003CC6F1C1
MVNRQLPEDVIIEILIRLPVKSIVKLRCVSRTWRDLIGSPIFIHRYQNRERKQSVLLVKRYLMQNNGPEPMLSFHHPDFPELLVSPNLSIPVLPDLVFRPRIYSDVQMYGPCNGLVCIPFVDIIFLCNPALREFKPLPLLNIPCPQGYDVFPFEFGFGFDPNTGAYKVIQISLIASDNWDDFVRKQDHYSRIDLYNSASNSWKRIDAKLPEMVYARSFQIFFSGVLHWFAWIDSSENHPCILCFDIRTEAFQLLAFPEDFPKSEDIPSLMVLNESLAMVRYPQWSEESGRTEIEIWVMKQYGEKESWTKQFVIGPYMVVCPFLFLNDEWLLVESENGQWAVCALEGNQFVGLQFYGISFKLSAVVYVESLISLNHIISGVPENE